MFHVHSLTQQLVLLKIGPKVTGHLEYTKHLKVNSVEFQNGFAYFIT